jgi:GcrA cell cycle regulator
VTAPDLHIGNKWPVEHDEALKRHYGLGLSCALAAVEINREFGSRYTRNAAIGRAGRIGLIGNGQAPRKPKVVKERRSNASDHIPRKRWSAPKPKPEPEVIALRCAEVVPRNVGLLDLAPADCRYPYGEGPYVFCGLPLTEGSSYCSAHNDLCRGHMR